MNILDKALGFACIAHAGQFRKDGKTPYIVHPIEVMRFLQNQCQIKDDDELLAAALLHDVMEDCTVSESIISENFNNRISGIVSELTIVEESKQKYLDGFKNKSDSALLIKCVDRLCNVNDYLWGGDHDYGFKYLKRADCLFQYIKERTMIRANVKLAILKEYERLRGV